MTLPPDSEPPEPFGDTASPASEWLAIASPPAAPGPRLRCRVLSAVGDLGFYFCRADRGRWEHEPGLERKPLFVDPHDRGESQLVRLSPGAAVAGAGVLPPHAVLVVVEGALQVAGETLGPGDAHTPGGAPAGELSTARGALLFVLLPPPGLAPDAAEPPRTVRAVALRWREAAAGTEVALVQRSHARGSTVALMRMAAGARYEPHHHEGAEETFLLTGECVAQGRAVSAGDYHRGAAGSDHAEVTTTSGCTMVLVTHAASRGGSRA